MTCSGWNIRERRRMKRYIETATDKLNLEICKQNDKVQLELKLGVVDRDKQPGI